LKELKIRKQQMGLVIVQCMMVRSGSVWFCMGQCGSKGLGCGLRTDAEHMAERELVDA
jgi:hypothetical protein